MPIPWYNFLPMLSDAGQGNLPEFREELLPSDIPGFRESITPTPEYGLGPTDGAPMVLPEWAENTQPTPQYDLGPLDMFKPNFTHEIQGRENYPIGLTGWGANPYHYGFMTKMSPWDFRQLAGYRGFGKNRERIDWLKNKMLEGREMAPPFLKASYDPKDNAWNVTGHEGRTRAEALMELGYKEPMPVWVHSYQTTRGYRNPYRPNRGYASQSGELRGSNLTRSMLDAFMNNPILAEETRWPEVNRGWIKPDIRSITWRPGGEDLQRMEREPSKLMMGDPDYQGHKGFPEKPTGLGGLRPLGGIAGFGPGPRRRPIPTKDPGNIVLGGKKVAGLLEQFSEHQDEVDAERLHQKRAQKREILDRKAQEGDESMKKYLDMDEETLLMTRDKLLDLASSFFKLLTDDPAGDPDFDKTQEELRKINRVLRDRWGYQIGDENV